MSGKPKRSIYEPTPIRKNAKPRKVVPFKRKQSLTTVECVYCLRQVEPDGKMRYVNNGRRKMPFFTYNAHLKKAHPEIIMEQTEKLATLPEPSYRATLDLEWRA